MLDAPQLAEVVTPEQRSLLETDPDFAPVVALVDTVKATGVATTGALFEAVEGLALRRAFMPKSPATG